MIYNTGWGNLKPQQLKYTVALGKAAAEVKARAAKLGIWSMPNPTAPWGILARNDEFI